MLSSKLSIPNLKNRYRSLQIANGSILKGSTYYISFHLAARLTASCNDLARREERY